MKINPINIQTALPKYDVRRVSPSKEVSAADTDNVQLSGFAQIYAGAVKSLKESMAAPSPEQTQRAAQITRQIEEGTYEVDSAQIARKILQGTHFDADL